MAVPADSNRYVLSAKSLESGEVELNGTTLALGDNDALPMLVGEAFPAGGTTFKARTISFLGVPEANNEACK